MDSCACQWVHDRIHELCDDQLQRAQPERSLAFLSREKSMSKQQQLELIATLGRCA
jgi:hypothetical protein